MEAELTGIRLVIADLAGTTVDYGSCAPAGAFVELFRRHGVAASIAEARGPMGMHKRDHIRAMLAEPELAARWTEAHGRQPAEDDIEALFTEFIPLQLDCLPDYTALIPGVAVAVAQLKAQGVKLAATTGYNEEMTRIVLDAAAAQGFTPDAWRCAAQVKQGRPAPWMIFQLLEELEVYPPAAVVKVGDTVADMEAARNAGVWAIGVVKTGNMLGLSEAEAKALGPDELEHLLAAGRARLSAAGAHHVVDSFADAAALLAP